VTIRLVALAGWGNCKGSRQPWTLRFERLLPSGAGSSHRE
jgi:hypothetical protein